MKKFKKDALKPVPDNDKILSLEPDDDDDDLDDVQEENSALTLSEKTALNNALYQNYLARNYEGCADLQRKTKQRGKNVPGLTNSKIMDTFLKASRTKVCYEVVVPEGKKPGDIIQVYDTIPTPGISNLKSRVLSEMERILRTWDIYTSWLKKIYGIGPSISCNLILLHEFRFIPICKNCRGDLELRSAKENGEEGNDEEDEKKGFFCKKCGKPAKKQGTLEYRMENKEFPTISKWWAYCGAHTVKHCKKCNIYLKEEDQICPMCKGTLVRVKPNKRKGMKINWSIKGRSMMAAIGQQFGKQCRSAMKNGEQPEDKPYINWMLKRYKNIEMRHPDWPENHVFNAARFETVKLLLAHFWIMSRHFKGQVILEPEECYDKPFYWNENDIVYHKKPKKKEGK